MPSISFFPAAFTFPPKFSIVTSRDQALDKAPAAPRRKPRLRLPTLGLTDRQMEVLALMMLGQEQQGNLPCARPCRGDGENSRLRNPQDPEGSQPHGSGHHGRGTGSQSEAGRRIVWDFAICASIVSRSSHATEEGTRASEVFSSRFSVVRKAIGDTGLCNRWKPPALASRSRSGAVSPVMTNAGTGAPTAWRRRSMASMPVWPSASRRVGDDQVRWSAVLPEAGERFCARSRGLDLAAPTLQDPTHAIED